MDPEEKEQLQQNDLATWFQVGLPLFLKKYGSYLMLVAALCLLAFELYTYYQKKHAVEVQTAWADLAVASGPDVDNPPLLLQHLIEEHDVKPVQAFAWLRIGNVYLETVDMGNPPEGYHGVKATKEEALTKAQTAYNKILSDFADQPLVLGSAHMGLATVAEDRSDFDEAKKQYQILTATPFTDSAFAKAAQKKLDSLNDVRNAPNLAALVPPPSTLPAMTNFNTNNLMGPASPLPALPTPDVLPPAPATATAPAK